LHIRALSAGRRAGLGLALALAMLASGVAGADPSPAWDKCGPASTPAPGGTSNGACTSTAGTKVKMVTVTPPAPPMSASPAVVNVSMTCSPGCAPAPEPKASAVAEAAPWPAWAVAHLAADDAIRQQDHLLRGMLMVLAIALACVLGVYAARLAERTAEQARGESDLRFTSHWGGFGGSTGGWQVTPALVSLLCAGVLAATAAVIVGCVLDAARSPAPASPAVPVLAAPGGAASEKK